VWADGRPHEPEPVAFAADLSELSLAAGERLRFEAEAVARAVTGSSSSGPRTARRSGPSPAPCRGSAPSAARWASWSIIAPAGDRRPRQEIVRSCTKG